MFLIALIASTFVLKDTATVAPPPYADNRADSLRFTQFEFIGPGPFTVHFEAHLTAEGANPWYSAWELASDASFHDILERYHDLSADGRTAAIDYDFNTTGSYYARYRADFKVGDDIIPYNDPQRIYHIQVTESLLEVPNIFTPQSESGANRTFKVKYKSLAEYEIWIYNRWGNELFHSSDPAEGWDGRQGGNYVPTGVYFYLIKARGTDNVDYLRKGSINVLRTRQLNNTH